SMGKLGNETVPIDTFKPLLAFGKSSWLNKDGDQIFYAGPPSPLPETVGWEEVTTKNIGLDFGVIKNKLTGTVEVYEKEIDKMYLPGEPLPSVFGASEPRRNYAALKNKGWELSLNYQNSFIVMGSDLQLNIGANITNYNGRITKYDNAEKLLSS